jgi:beta-lactamase regulating signal transducer with metallopeptidase domain
VPAGTLADAPAEELEWLLVHELAHARRADVAWLQALVEVALFFHPAARWLAQHVRRERECCCDAATAPRSSTRRRTAHAARSSAPHRGQRREGRR